MGRSLLSYLVATLAIIIVSPFAPSIVSARNIHHLVRRQSSCQRSYPQSCVAGSTTPSQCCRGTQSCGARGYCCYAVGARGCTNTNQCCESSSTCRGGVCETTSCQGQPGDFCSSSGSNCCKSPSICGTARCCLPQDYPGCSRDSDCCDVARGVKCWNGECRMPPCSKNLGDTCMVGTSAINGNCCKFGQGSCTNGRCCLVTDAAGSCSKDLDCCDRATGAKCIDNRCIKPQPCNRTPAQPCTQGTVFDIFDGSCCTSGFCRGNPSKCCLLMGSSGCNKDGDCCESTSSTSNVACVSGKCTLQIPALCTKTLSQPCTPGSNSNCCKTGQGTCTNNKCCLATGLSGCSTAADCCDSGSGVTCSGGLCKKPCIATDSQGCSVTSDCCEASSGATCDSGTCKKPLPGCEKELGDQCTAGSTSITCCKIGNGICESGTCCISTNAPGCNDDSHCCESGDGVKCLEGTCKVPPPPPCAQSLGDTCTPGSTSTTCCKDGQGTCDSGAGRCCLATDSEGCENDLRCCESGSGVKCTNGKCTAPPPGCQKSLGDQCVVGSTSLTCCKDVQGSCDSGAGRCCLNTGRNGCSSDGHCCASGAKCESSKCCASVGSQCTSHADCCVGPEGSGGASCTNGVCVKNPPCKQTLGQMCSWTGASSIGLCCVGDQGLSCPPVGDNKCCYASGTDNVCTKDEDCCDYNRPLGPTHTGCRENRCVMFGQWPTK